MINEDLKGLNNVSNVNDEFSSIENLLVAIEKSWLAKKVNFHNDEDAINDQISFSEDVTFCSNNTIVFFSYDCSLFDQCFSR